MTGVRVTGIPEEVTEKQLKVYFSNPNNGGGAVRHIYYPLQNNCAVILFESPSVMLEIFKTRHHLEGFELGVTALPRQIYEKGVMEIEKGVSVILSFHRAVIDELQYIGNLKVDFDYNQECYMLKGTWYQLEWALHLLDRTMDSIEGITKTTTNKSGTTASQPVGSSRDSPTFRSEGSPVRTPSLEIRSNSPVLLSHVPITSEAGAFSPVSGAAGYTPGAAGYTSETLNFFFKDEDHQFPRDKDYSRERQGRGTGKKDKINIQTKDGSNKSTIGPISPPMNRRGNEKGLNSRGLSSKKGTAFSEIKPKPKRPVGPSLTPGMDVSLTGFGESKLSYSFELKNVLRVMVVKADITKQRTDGIVSPNTPDLSNAYGVASAIARAADRSFLTECQRYVREHGCLRIADVIHTNAGGNLSPHVGFILHAVGPHWREDDSEAAMHYLVCTYLNCFLYSETTLWVKSLSTPLISAGAYGFPLDSCIQAFFDALLIHVTYVDHPPHLQEIQLVCFDSDSAGAAIMILQSLLEVDRSQSETAALERYQTGCMKYSFNAKLLKIRPEASDATLDSTKKDKQRDEVVTVSSDNDSDKEEANTDDEKKPLIAKMARVDQTDNASKEEQVPNEVNNRFGYEAEDKHKETEVTGVKITYEQEATQKAVEVFNENNSDLNDGAIGYEDRIEEGQQKQRRTEMDSDVCDENTYIDPCKVHMIDVDDSAESSVKRSLSDDDKEESVFSGLKDKNVKYNMSKMASKIRDDASQDANKNKLNIELDLDDEEHKMKGCAIEKDIVTSVFQHELNIGDGNREESSQQVHVGKACDMYEMETESKRQLDTRYNLEPVQDAERSDMLLPVDDSAEIQAEMNESGASSEFQLRNEIREASSEDSIKTFSDTEIQAKTSDLDDPDGRGKTKIDKEDFSQSQWSIVPEKIILDEDVD